MPPRWVAVSFSVAVLGCASDRMVSLTADAVHCTGRLDILPAAPPHGPGSWIATCGRDVYDCKGNDDAVTCEPHQRDPVGATSSVHTELEHAPPIEPPPVRLRSR